MAMALGLARRGLGNVWPNPAVGCVVARDGRVIARGWTQPGGRPHAEAVALGRAGAAARGATLYVTLEPCNHAGQTPPCTEAILDAGIGRCVVAAGDPDSRVSGRGLGRLRDAGMEVIADVCTEEAHAVNAGYFMRLDQGRPLITLKLATSLDGRIATHGRHSRWITGEPARRRAHLMRARHDAIMIGAGTAIQDRPRLTCRLPGLEGQSPVRVVVDSRLQVPLTSPLVSTAGEVATWIVTAAGAEPRRRAAFSDCGVEIIEVAAGPDGHASLAEAVRALGARGVTRLLVEGGGRLAAGLLQASLVDRLAWFRAPMVIGGDGIAAAAAFGIDNLEQAPRFQRLGAVEIGEDMLETFAVLA
jgi:diaminohydroxyphosphoribosylaminopyrimidine deaminase/5-amino-6-(5-phosphoribosylamino)uracil reductase